MTSKLQNQDAWHGVWTALISPLKAGKNPSLDLKSLESFLERQIAAGIHGFVMAGSTGEGSLLPKEDYFKLLKTTRTIVGKRAFLVAGLGIGGTRSCLENLEIAKKSKMDGVLASPPAYIKAPERYLETHYLTLAAGGLPVCVYEIPGRAAMSMSVDFLVKLCAHKKSKMIVATKDATASLPRISEEKERLGKRLALLSGDDGTYASFLNLGGHGVISVASHFFPEAFVEMTALAKSQEFEKANEIQSKMVTFIEGLFSESNPIPCKSLAKNLKWISQDVFHAPLGPMDPEKLRAFKETFLSTQASLKK